jgi:uncharacterized Zn finger protein
MPKKKDKLERFTHLTWSDLGDWVGGKIVSRGKRYQGRGLVSDLAVTADEGLIAWVKGTRKYATKVVMKRDGLPEATCTCPYDWDCKHGVAVVIEYLKRIEENRSVPKVKRGDPRLKMLEDEACGDASADAQTVVSAEMQQEIDRFLKGKTKAQLIALIHDIARQHPDVAQEIVDRRQLSAGHPKALVARLRCEIQEIGSEPGWQDYWRGDGYTPDYSGIQRKLETLLDAGHADAVLTLGGELVTTGMHQVEESHDEGETMMAVAGCMPVIVKALERSSLDHADKLNWALGFELEDQYELCEEFSEYLHRKHPRSAWHALADRLRLRLKEMKAPKGKADYGHRYERDRLSDWLIHALTQAGREEEIVTLCETEARKTGNYSRLVELLISARRYEAAEKWIREGHRTTQDKWPGIAAGLRDKLLEIRIRQKNWHAVAAMQVEAFVSRPSRQAYAECKKAAGKIKVWPTMRQSLLHYLETGEAPWKKSDWSLPASGLELASTAGGNRAAGGNRFPMVSELIEMALVEKDAKRVLHWYDRLPKKGYRRYGVDDDEVATIVQSHYPDRAVAIWQRKAGGLINQVKPKAYLEAGVYLRKAAKAMAAESKKGEWDTYLQNLRKHHARKIRLMEVLDSLDNKPIIRKRD